MSSLYKEKKDDLFIHFCNLVEKRKAHKDPFIGLYVIADLKNEYKERTDELQEIINKYEKTLPPEKPSFFKILTFVLSIGIGVSCAYMFDDFWTSTMACFFILLIYAILLNSYFDRIRIKKTTINILKTVVAMNNKTPFNA